MSTFSPKSRYKAKKTRTNLRFNVQLGQEEYTVASKGHKTSSLWQLFHDALLKHHVGIRSVAEKTKCIHKTMRRFLLADFK